MAKIFVEFKEVTALAKLFEVSRVTVVSALRYRTKSRLADQIRTAAIKRGGVKKTD